MPENLQLREVHNSETAIIDFDSLVQNLPDARDKLLACVIATLADVGLAEQFISHLVNLPEPVNINRVMHGVRVDKLMGMSSESAQRAFNLNAEQVRDIQEYLGLNDNSAKVSKGYVAGIRE